MIRIFILSVVLTMTLNAQSSEIDTLVNENLEGEMLESGTDLFEHQHFATFSPSAFINTTPGIQFGYEYLVAKKISFLGEAGYLFNSTNQRQGVRIKGEVRTYFSPKFFMGIEYVYKNTVTQVTDWVDVQTHEQLLSFKGIRNLSYCGPKLGVMLPLMEDSDFYIEFASTLGFARYRVSQKGLPEEYTLLENRGFLWDQTFSARDNSFPIATLSIKIKYNFGKDG